MTRLLPVLLSVAAIQSASAQTPSVQRVLVTDMKPIDCEREDVASLPGMIEKEIAKRPGFEVISHDKLAAAVNAGGGSDSVACAAAPACLAKMAQQAGSTLVVTGSLEKKKKGYVLSLKAIDPKNPSKAGKDSESMKRLGSLALNVPLVLNRLLKGNDDEMPIPPPEFDLPPEEAPAPPAAPATTATDTAAPAAAPQTQRIAFLAVKVKDVDADDAKDVPALVVKALASRKGYEAVPLADTAAAIQKAGKDAAACAEDKGCATQVAEAVHAQLVMTALLSKSHGKYALQLSLAKPGEAKGTNATESMKRLSSVAMNVPLCLDSLLK